MKYRGGFKQLFKPDIIEEYTPYIPGIYANSRVGLVLLTEEIDGYIMVHYDSAAGKRITEPLENIPGSWSARIEIII